MQIKVDNVSKTRKGVVTNDTWYNFPKDGMETFDENVKRGTLLELNLDGDGKTVLAYKVVGAPTAKKAYTPKSTIATDPNRDAKIALGNALNAAFGPIYTNLTGKEGQSHEEAYTKTMQVVKEIAALLMGVKA